MGGKEDLAKSGGDISTWHFSQDVSLTQELATCSQQRNSTFLNGAQICLLLGSMK